MGHSECLFTATPAHHPAERMRDHMSQSVISGQSPQHQPINTHDKKANEVNIIRNGNLGEEREKWDKTPESRQRNEKDKTTQHHQNIQDHTSIFEHRVTHPWTPVKLLTFQLMLETHLRINKSNLNKGMQMYVIHKVFKRMLKLTSEHM